MVRKTVTLVFCDVVDSTPLGERLDPEALRGVWSRYHDCARQVLERHGGTVEKFVGHLSQTFYLACAELGLGAFVTAAINNADIDDRLGVDGFAQGSLAIVGCGPLVEESSYLQPEFAAHRPPR